MLKIASATSIARDSTRSPLDAYRPERGEQAHREHEELCQHRRGEDVHVADAKQVDADRSPDHVAEDHADEGRDGQQPGESAPTSADGEKDEEIDDRQKRYPESQGGMPTVNSLRAR